MLIERRVEILNKATLYGLTDIESSFNIRYRSGTHQIDLFVLCAKNIMLGLEILCIEDKGHPHVTSIHESINSLIVMGNGTIQPASGS